jgi:hypothetical protein
MTRRALRSIARAGLLAGGLAACDDLFGGNSPSTVELRVENRSTVTFEVATIATLDGLRSWQDVAPGATTPYVQVSAGYDYISAEVVTETDTLRLQVIDYVGEEYLPSGQYTYLLDIADPASDFPSLIQTFRRDN